MMFNMSMLRHRFSKERWGGGGALNDLPLLFCKSMYSFEASNQNIFEKFQLNRNLQTIPFKIMYNMSMLRHRFSNERWGGGGGALNHLPLLFCKSVYYIAWQFRTLLRLLLDL